MRGGSPPSPDCPAAHGALHAVQTTQLGQFAAPALQLVDASLQVVGQLAQLLHGAHVLHEDALLRTHRVRGSESQAGGRGGFSRLSAECL